MQIASPAHFKLSVGTNAGMVIIFYGRYSFQYSGIPSSIPVFRGEHPEPVQGWAH